MGNVRLYRKTKLWETEYALYASDVNKVSPLIDYTLTIKSYGKI